MPFPPPPPAIVRQLAQAEERIVLKVTIHDGLLLGETVSPATEPLTIYILTDPHWTADGDLLAPQKERLLQSMYGADWRNGNSDGSAYLVLKYASSALSADEAKAEAWRTAPGAWLYLVGPSGAIEKLGEGYVPKR